MVYKLGAFSDDLASGFETGARLGADAGLDGIAVRNVGGRNVVDAPAAEVRLIKQQADAYGLEISVLGTQYGRGFYMDDDDAQRAAEDVLEIALRHADILDTPLIRAFALWLPGQEAPPTWSLRPSYPGCLEQLERRLRRSVQMVERAGHTLMLELEGASYVGRLSEAQQLVKMLDSPAVAVCWDVANAWWSGERPVPDGLELATSLPLVDVQAKDVRAVNGEPQRAGFERAVVGEGAVPYSAIVSAMQVAAYQGWFHAERVHHPSKPEQETDLQQETLADIANLKALLAGAAA